MKKLLGILSIVMALSLSLFAGDKSPLFTNITSDKEHRTLMAIQFSLKMHEKGHPLTVYLNDEGVKLASKENKQYKEFQSKLLEGIKKGVKVYICPMCMKEYKIEGSTLIDGLKIGNANLLEKAIFADDTRVISW